MPNIYKMSNAGGFKSLTRYQDMLAGNAVWNPWSPEGAYDALASTTLTGSVSSVSFAGIPATYKHLQLRVMARDNSGSSFAAMFIKLNDANGVRRHELYGTGSSVGAGSDPSSFVAYIGGVTGYFGSAVVDIFDYASTTKYKTTRGFSGIDNNGSGLVALTSGMNDSTSAVTSINIYANGSTFAQYSSFALYGVK